MSDSTIETISISDAAPPEAAAVRELVEERKGWPLERYEAESRTDWARMWQAWFMVGLAFIEVLLAFRLGFKLAAANPLNGFVDIIYGLSAPLAAPFDGIIAATQLGANGSFEPSILVAMFAYLMAALLLCTIAWAVRTTDAARSRHPSAFESRVSPR